MKIRVILCTLAWTYASVAWADTPAASLPDIMRGLSSSNFAAREAAQAQLSKLPPDQAETLKQAAGKETDPEIKARLLSQAEAMETYIAIHPAPLSIDVRDDSLEQVVDALNGKIPDRPMLVGKNADPSQKFTLHAVAEPFWAIVRELDRQNALEIKPHSPFTRGGLLMGPPDKGASVSHVAVADTFATQFSFRGTPAKGEWEIYLLGFADPRINIASTGPMRLDEIADQDGHSLLPSVTVNAPMAPAPTRDNPHLPWAGHIRFAAVPGLTHFSRLKISREVMVFDRVTRKAIDLAKTDRIETPQGTVTVRKNADSSLTFRLPTADGSAVAAPPTTFPPRVAAAAAAPDLAQTIIVQLDATPVRNLRMNLTAGAERTTPAFSGVLTGSVSWAEGVHQATVTFDLKDMAVPAVNPPIIRAAGGEAAVAN